MLLRRGYAFVAVRPGDRAEAVADRLATALAERGAVVSRTADGAVGFVGAGIGIPRNRHRISGRLWATDHPAGVTVAYAVDVTGLAVCGLLATIALGFAVLLGDKPSHGFALAYAGLVAAGTWFVIRSAAGRFGAFVVREGVTPPRPLLSPSQTPGLR